MNKVGSKNCVCLEMQWTVITIVIKTNSDWALAIVMAADKSRKS